MFSWSGLDDVTLYGRTVAHHTGDAPLLAVGVLQRAVKLCIAQHTVYRILLERGWYTRINLDTVVGGLDTQYVLRNGNPVPS